MLQIVAIHVLQRHAGTLGSDVFLYSASHVSSCEFQYPDLTWKELCGLLSTLVAESGVTKGIVEPPFGGIVSLLL